MSLLELILLLLILLAVIVVIGAALYCKGMAAMGSSEIPVNGVIHVQVSDTTCRSFTVQFETSNPVTEVSGTINLTSDIAQTISATYTSSQTHHELTFSNGSYGLAKDTWYAYNIMGRDAFDHPPEAEIVTPFIAKTGKCCWRKLLPFLSRIVQVYEASRLPQMRNSE